MFCFFFQAEDGIRDIGVTGVQTCALPISSAFPDTLEASIPAAATTQPCGVSTIFSGPRRATTRTVCSSMARCRAASRSSPGATGTKRPSTLDTTLEVTTTTSPSASQGAAPANAAARSSPGENSGSPRTGRTVSPSGGTSDTGGVQRGPRHRRGRLGGGHEQRDGADADAGDVGAVAGVHQPGVEQPAGGPGAVVQPHPVCADLHAE